MSSGVITADLDKAGLRRLRELSRKFPRETYRGIGRAGATLRSKMRKVMRVGGGIDGVPKMEALDVITEELRAEGLAGSRKTTDKIGGVLSKSSAIQMFKNGKGKFQVGFMTVLEPYARMFQEDQIRQLTPGERRLYSLAGFGDVVLYDRPARPMVDPFSTQASRDLTRWAIRNTEKILEKAASKAS